ncbi:MAG TPA: hypothetical protein VNP94_09755 [Actinomycetota bacterium]|nr:hypothetical protein [Actinomycetota bacterium]
MPRLAVLDESKDTKGHPIFGVGGIVVDLGRIQGVEAAWVAAKGTHEAIKFSETPADRCLTLFQAIGRMPLQALVCLLEDFRPPRMRIPGTSSRRDIYVVRQAFEYALQRLSKQFTEGSPEPHFVAFDRRDDFPQLEGVYSRCYEGSWPIGRGQPWPALKTVGFTASLLTLAHGPLHEMADFVVGGLTLFAAVRCAELRGKRLDEGRLAKHRTCAPVVSLLPRRPGTGTRVGWSVVVHPKQLTGKELLKPRLETWLDELEDRGSGLGP